MNSSEKDQIIHEFCTTIDALLKRTSVAQLGGFRPEAGLKSWFGGDFWLPKESPWPEWKGQPMLPILQVVIEEMPCCPPALTGVQILQLFLGQEDLPGDACENGDGFLIKTYCDENIAPREAPFTYDSPKSFQIRWSEGPMDAPTWEEAGNIVDRALFSKFVETNAEDEFFFDRYDCLHATKFGGWPSYVQGGPSNNLGEFIFQVDTEPKAHFGVADGGSLYFYLTKDMKWTVYWDSL